MVAGLLKTDIERQAACSFSFYFLKFGKSPFVETLHPDILSPESESRRPWRIQVQTEVQRPPLREIETARSDNWCGPKTAPRSSLPVPLAPAPSTSKLSTRPSQHFQQQLTPDFSIPFAPSHAQIHSAIQQWLQGTTSSRLQSQRTQGKLFLTTSHIHNSKPTTKQSQPSQENTEAMPMPMNAWYPVWEALPELFKFPDRINRQTSTISAPP